MPTIALPQIQLEPPQLANTLWAVARLGFRNRPLFEALAASSIRSIREFSPLALSKTAWAIENNGMQPFLHHFHRVCVDAYVLDFQMEASAVILGVSETTLEGSLSTIDVANSICQVVSMRSGCWTLFPFGRADELCSQLPGDSHVLSLATPGISRATAEQDEAEQ